jgi:hypothetical protein
VGVCNQIPFLILYYKSSRADDTSILFTHSNLIKKKKNISIVFTTLNKWLGANHLSLNFNKTNYVYFTTKEICQLTYKKVLTIILLPTAFTQNSWG